MLTTRRRDRSTARSRLRSLRLAVTCWSVAIAVAVVESAVAVDHAVSTRRMHGGVIVETVVHLTVFAVAVWLIVGLANGRAHARTALTVLLSVIGVAAIVLPAAVGIATGSPVATALGADVSSLFPWLRVVHVALVVVATAAMYRDTTSRHRFGGRLTREW